MKRSNTTRALAWSLAATMALQLAALSQALPGGTLDPTSIPKYQTPLLLIPAMPTTHKPGTPGSVDYYEIAVRQFRQQVLPPGLGSTTVWGYGSANHPGTFHYPALTIEAKVNRPVRVKWINQLVDSRNRFLPHLLPVDQTLHWANPPGPRDSRGVDPRPYRGPVPIITHLHGAHATQESDGYPEAWYLPAAANIPAGFFTAGTFFGINKALSPLGAQWTAGSAVFEYRNDQRATTLWYHDHALGMTRLNVYAGLAGFYLLRGGPSDLPSGLLPGPAPSEPGGVGRQPYEIPVAIQDRSFNADGSLFYPGDRAFFEGLSPDQLRIPFTPAPACDGQPSDVAPIWNPEFFGNTMVVNGNTWPVLDVEQRVYRLRLLNGCGSRFLILKLVTGNPTARPGTSALPFVQIGSEGGFLPAPVALSQLLMAKAERADVLVDFGALPVGTEVFLINEGPDEPFGGGVAGTDFAYSDPDTTGQVMKFVVGPRRSRDGSVQLAKLKLPKFTPVGPATNTRQLSLNELESANVLVDILPDGSVVTNCVSGIPFGPTEARLGTLMIHQDGTLMPMPMMWADPVTENPALGATEVWEIYNFTMDAHPIHVHVVQFQVVNRQPIGGAARPPETWESGLKDTVIAYPGEITRIRALFDIPGQFVWHCHILEHEDNEMMRPYRIGP